MLANRVDIWVKFSFPGNDVKGCLEDLKADLNDVFGRTVDWEVTNTTHTQWSGGGPESIHQETDSEDTQAGEIPESSDQGEPVNKPAG